MHLLTNRVVSQVESVEPEQAEEDGEQHGRRVVRLRAVSSIII